MPRSVPVNGTYATDMVGDTVTRNSFLLPDLPNLSELVSGVYEALYIQCLRELDMFTPAALQQPSLHQHGELSAWVPPRGQPGPSQQRSGLQYRELLSWAFS